MSEHEIEIRVRYCETDAMGYLHHSHYLSYFESGRTELLRAAGGNYRGMEERGLFMVIVKAEVRYHQPARYDDLLRLRTRVARITPAKLEHEYRLTRGKTLLAEGRTTLACVDRQGTVQRMTDVLPEEAVEG
jgi:acyl-CoA thioester hydrolase